MSSRELGIVLVRVLGLVTLVIGLLATAEALAMILSRDLEDRSFAVMLGVFYGALVLAAALLMIGAPWICRVCRIGRTEAEAGVPLAASGAVASQALFAVGRRIVGLVSLLWAIRPLALLLTRAFSERPQDGGYGQGFIVWGESVTSLWIWVGAYVAFGTVLLLGPGPVGRVIGGWLRRVGAWLRRTFVMPRPAPEAQRAGKDGG